jgi:hypothetical protein
MTVGSRDIKRCALRRPDFPGFIYNSFYDTTNNGLFELKKS